MRADLHVGTPRTRPGHLALFGGCDPVSKSLHFDADVARSFSRRVPPLVFEILALRGLQCLAKVAATVPSTWVPFVFLTAAGARIATFQARGPDDLGFAA